MSKTVWSDLRSGFRRGYLYISPLVLALFVGYLLVLDDQQQAEITALEQENQFLSSELFLTELQVYHLGQETQRLSNTIGTPVLYQGRSTPVPVSVADNLAGLTADLQSLWNQQLGDHQAIRDRDPDFGLHAASVFYDQGDVVTAKAIGVYAMSQLVGDDHYGCRTVPLTQPMYLGVNAAKVNNILAGSPYAIAEAFDRDGAEWVRVSVNNFIPGC